MNRPKYVASCSGGKDSVATLLLAAQHKEPLDEDGSVEVVSTERDWKTSSGALIFNSIYTAEHYDARLEQKGWNTVNFDDSKWNGVGYRAVPSQNVVSQQVQPIRAVETIPVKTWKKLNDTTYVFDFARNMAGITRIKVSGEEGTVVRLKHGERLYDNGRVNTSNIDVYHRPVDNSDPFQTDILVLSGKGEDEFMARFNYKGFRYVEVTSTNPLVLNENSLTAYFVHSDVPQKGTIHTSNALINRLWWATNNAYLSNLMGYPTDCPQRDERLGWLGDRTTGAYGESFIFGNALMYKKWLVDIEESMNENGSISVVSPRYWTIFHDDVTWPAAYFYVADMLYRQFGDDSSIKERYPSMKRWVNHMTETKMKDYILVKDEYGDWCMPPESPELIHSEDPARKTNGEVLSTTVFYSILQLMEKFAQMNGLPADAEEYAALAIKIKDAYNKKFFNPGTAQYDNNTVTANLLSLRLGLVPDGYEDKVFANVVEKTEKDCKGHVSAGVLGIQHLMRGLTEYGGLELAYKIVTNDTYPSWGYMIKKGATTIWELWNGDTANPAMNSRNHVMLLGDLLIWFYEDLAGIKNTPTSVGFKQILMEPVFPEKLNYVNASHVSPYGRIGSSWKRDGNKLKWNVEIPANTTATVKLPLDFHVQVDAGQAGIHSVEEADGKLVVELGSGKYVFMSE